MAEHEFVLSSWNYTLAMPPLFILFMITTLTWTYCFTEAALTLLEQQIVFSIMFACIFMVAVLYGRAKKQVKINN